jgi:prepilin-type N-terminal cleavage/methylation domain-containing protein
MKNLSGFTLAETLIAIGIIGVVAALTIPTLIKNYQKRVIEINLKKTYAEISNIIRQSEADNGTFDGWDYSIGADAVLKKYIMPYIQLYPCKLNCFDPKVGNWGNWHSGKDNKVADGIYNVPPKYYTKDGRHIEFVPHKYADWTSLIFVVDVNGNTGKSVMGQDVFGITPKRWGNGNLSISMNLHHPRATNLYSDEWIQQQCFKKDYDGAYCGEWIKRNGWKFPKNYPYEIGTKSE